MLPLHHDGMMESSIFENASPFGAAVGKAGIEPATSLTRALPQTCVCFSELLPQEPSPRLERGTYDLKDRCSFSELRGRE